MSLSTPPVNECGQAPKTSDVTLIRPRKSRDTVCMTILLRMISIAVRKYASNPNDRAPAVRMLLRNAVRLAVSHLGKEQSEAIAFEALQERPQ